MSSTRDAATVRRWYPARLFLPHESIHPVWFHPLQVVFLLGVPQLPLWFIFFRARRRYAAGVRAAAALARGATGVQCAKTPVAQALHRPLS
jgi:hypothetical protein